MDHEPIDRFFGNYPHTVDGKNRVTIPSKWRSEATEVLYALEFRKLGIIKLMPREELERQGKSVLNNPRFTPAMAKQWRRNLYGSTPECPMDKEGRVVLPASMMDDLGLPREVMLVGVGELIEVWDRVLWKQRQEEFRTMFDAMAEEGGL